MENNPSYNEQNRCRNLTHKSVIFITNTWSFIFSVIFIVCWMMTGTVFHVSPSWQIAINSAASLVVLLMCLLILKKEHPKEEKVIVIDPASNDHSH